MDLILQLNAQMKEMENVLDNLIQLKQASLETSATTTIPIVITTVPSTLVASLAPTAPLATSYLATTTTTSVIGSTTTAAQPSHEASKLVKAMKDMSIRTTEIYKLKEQKRSLEDEKKLALIM